jgi:hypothetical protein
MNFQPKEDVRSKRQRLDCRLSLIDRRAVHQENDAGLILAQSELLALAFEIKLECVRNVLLHDLLPLFVRDWLSHLGNAWAFSKCVKATSLPCPSW